MSSEDGTKRRVRIKDIAIHLGISPRSVSQALSNSESTTKVSVKKREIIRQAARSMGYRPDRVAKALRTGRTGVIGILVFNFQHPFVIQRLQYVMKAVQDAGYTPSTLLTRSTHEEVLSSLHSMLDARVEGIVAVQPPSVFGANFSEFEETTHTPMVALGGFCLDSKPSFIPNRRADCHALVMHVARQGARSLQLVVGDRDRRPKSKILFNHEGGFVFGFRDGIVTARREGFPVSGRVRKIDQFEPKPEREGDVHRLYLHGYRVVLQLIDEGKLPDALLFQGDVWAQGALRACAEHGIRVPEDLMVTGYDNDPGSSAGFVPLTTVAQSHLELSSLAVENLLQQISSGELANSVARTVPGTLIARRSSLRFPSLDDS